VHTFKDKFPTEIRKGEVRCATHSNLVYLEKSGPQCLQKNGVQDLPYLVWCASPIPFHSCDYQADKR
jgi:hypothetical protein